jgi:hypothetical protein
MGTTITARRCPISPVPTVLLATALTLLACTHDNPIAGLDTADETPSAVSTPTLRTTLPASWDENWYSSPAVFDIDNDGTREIIASRHSVLYVWSSTGTPMWRAAVGENGGTAEVHGESRMYCSPVVGDLDGDGMGEIAICYSNKVAVYDHTGTLHAGWPRSFPGSTSEIRSIAAADLDNNGTVEILVVNTSDSSVTNVWSIDGSQGTGWPQCSGRDPGDYGGFNQNIGIADLDGNGVRDIVSTYDRCSIGPYRADGTPWRANAMFADTFSAGVPMFHRLDLAKQGWGEDGNQRDEFTDSPPAFADMDGDGLPEIILYSDHERAGITNNLGNSLWVLNPDMTRVTGFDPPLTTGGPLYWGYEDNITQVAPAPCISRLGGSTPCVIVPSYDGWMRCYSSRGEVLWRVQFDATGSPFVGASEAVAGDLDADGVPEVVFTTYSIADNVSRLFILNSDGALLHRVEIAGRGSMAAPTLADVDNDGVIEIIISLKDALGSGSGGVQIWDVPSATAGNPDWPTGRGNYLRTGAFGG